MAPRVPDLMWLLVPESWRATVRNDIEEEARSSGRGRWWCVWQVTVVALRLRWAITGDTGMTDIRYAIRSLLHARWFTIGAALTFALGIGVNLAVFSAVDRILFRRLPYANPQEIVVLRKCSPTSGACGASFPDDVAREAGHLSTLGELAVATWTTPYAATPTPGEVPPLTLYGVSANLLRVLGVQPILGRDFTDDDARTKRSVVIVSFDTWQQRFGGQRSVLGRRIGRTGSVEIVGVLPRGFIPPSWMMTDPTWNGLALVANISVMAPIARLRPGASLAAARAEVAALVQALGSQASANAPAGKPRPTIRVDPLDAELFSRYQDGAWLVVVAAAVVLLMACANLAGLLLVRGRSREQEAAIRTALGASSGRIVFAAMFETGVVCLMGASLAWLALAWTSRVIGAMLPAVFGRYMTGVTDLRVIVAALGASAVCTLIAGVWPGVRMAHVQVATVLKRAGGAGRRTRLPGGRALLFVEAALGTLLVLGAVLAIRSFDVLATEDIGYQPKDLYRVLMSSAPSSSPAQSLADYKQALQLSAGLPNVIGVAGGDSVMAAGAAPMREFAKDRALHGSRYEVTAGFFNALGGALLAGREFTVDEVNSGAPVAMLNPAGVALVWPGVTPKEAVGRAVTLAGELPRQIIGIAPQVQRNAYGEAEDAAIYVPLGNEPRSYNSWIIRMTPGTTPQLASLRQRVTDRLGPRTVALASVADALEPSLKDPRFRAALLGTLALCALLLAAAGLYAMASFEVSLRRYEIGVRMTLGASAAQIHRRVILDALRPVAAGVIAGGISSFWTATWFQSFLYKVDGRDLRALGVVAVVLLATAAAAAWLPARRAAGTDPAVVLRTP